MLNFDQDITGLARDLIGARLLVRGVGGIVLETEAYGHDDPASHSFRGLTARNAAMFGGPGTVYVYLSYGCHLCLNVVGRPGEAVLIRAIRPERGVALMQERRGRSDEIAAGPGRVGQALGISLSDNGKRFGEEEFLLDRGSPRDSSPCRSKDRNLQGSRPAFAIWTCRSVRSKPPVSLGCRLGEAA
jgi:DNA-3-methyladenine glycosylase